jgi:predicted dehydrogenase
VTTRPPTFALVGAGNRGADVYAAYLLRHPEAGRLVAAADPDPVRLDRVASAHALPNERRYPDADALFAAGRLADVLVIATPDAAHVESAERGLALGYHLLLEKPLAPNLAGVHRIAAAARAHETSVTVAHVLRYTPFFRTIKRVLDEGRLGRLVNVDHVEHIGYWHFAHSYVRGNWRSEASSSPMILAKACHDLDVLRWLIDAPCRTLASFGSLRHFRPEEAPPGAGERCLACDVERDCPYSALRIYLERFADTDGWPISVITSDPSTEGRLEALRSGPYGRCVYRCDNDVVDHQVTALSFENGVTAALTVHAFSEANTRTITLHGSHGELHGRLDDGRLTLHDFVRGTSEDLSVRHDHGRHAGGDDGLMRDLTGRLRESLAGGAPPASPTSWEASLESHLMAFAAERSRRDGRVVALAELHDELAAPALV